MLDTLERYPSQTTLDAAGEKRRDTRLGVLMPRIGGLLAAQIKQALSEQSVVVVGTNAALLILS